MQTLTPEKAKQKIGQAVERLEREYYFPAIDKRIKLDEGRVALDLGPQKDFYQFIQELDLEIMGGSRIEFQEPRPEHPFGGMNTEYYFFDKNGHRVVAHVWTYTLSEDAGVNWKIRGHEEGHVLDKAIKNIKSLEEQIGRVLPRYNASSIPQYISNYASKIRGEQYQDVDLRVACIEDKINCKDYFVIPFGITPENNAELKILRSAVFFKGAHTEKNKVPIGENVKEILNYIDKQKYDNDLIRKKLRIISMYHDLGQQAAYDLPTSGMMHGHISAQIAKDNNLPEDVVKVIAVHDYPYYLFQGYSQSEEKVNQAAQTDLVRDLQGVDLDLLINFIEAAEKGRDTDAVKWFRRNLASFAESVQGFRVQSSGWKAVVFPER